MAEILKDSGNLESTTVGVFRTAATVKGGRRFSFSSLVVVGDREGRVGWGYGKSVEVPSAIEKAQKNAKRAIRDVPMMGRTIHHEVEGRFGASTVRLIPASPGTGVVAGQTVRAVLELAGIQDCLTKCYGSTNKINVVKAVFEGLSKLRLPEEIARLRGVELGKTGIQERIERAEKLTGASVSAGDGKDDGTGDQENKSESTGGEST